METVLKAQTCALLRLSSLLPLNFHHPSYHNTLNTLYRLSWNSLCSLSCFKLTPVLLLQHLEYRMTGGSHQVQKSLWLDFYVTIDDLSYSYNYFQTSASPLGVLIVYNLLLSFCSFGETLSLTVCPSVFLLCHHNRPIFSVGTSFSLGWRVSWI